MKIGTFQCDECGTFKKQTNNWFVFSEVSDTDNKALVIRPWSESEASLVDSLHCCGIECGLKQIAKKMEKLYA